MKNTVRLVSLATTILLLLYGLVLNTQAQYDNTSCNSIKGNGGSSGDGIYIINPTGNEEFEVYCDMTTDGGGWALVLSQYGESYTKFASRNVSRVLKDAPGSHEKIKEIFESSNEFRWTDTSMDRFLQGKTDMAVWWDKIENHNCDWNNSDGNTIDVRFENGWFNTSEHSRKVEACTEYPFGMRNINNLASFKDINGYDNSTTHMCWYDELTEDRPFSYSHDNFSSDRSYCTQFDYEFDTNANRGGSMNYYVWVRSEYQGDDGQTTTTLSITGGTTSVFTPLSIDFGELEVSSSEQEKNIELEAPNYFGIEDLKGQGGYYTTLQIGELSDGNKTLEVTEAKVKIPNGTIHTIAGQDGSNISVPDSASDFILFDSENPANILERAVTTNGKIGKYGVLPDIKLTIAAYQQVGDYEGTITFTIIEE